jgi:outer membrane protein assembly factor BamB
VGVRDVAPRITEREVFAPTDDGLAVFDRRTGAPTRSWTVGDRVSTPIVVNGSPIVTAWNGRLIALGRWEVPLAGPALGPPARWHDVVVAAWDAGVIAVRVDTGDVVWQRAFDGDGVSAPTIAGDVAVVVADGRVQAFDVRTGQARWSVAIGGAGSPEAPPAARTGEVAAVDRDGHLVVVGATGRVRRRADVGSAVVRAGPAWAGRAVVVPLDDGGLFLARAGRSARLDPPGRVAGVAAAGAAVVVATREGPANGVTGSVLR